MRVGFYSSEYTHCKNLTDLAAFQRCATQDDKSVAIRMFELMFEQIEFIALNKSDQIGNETAEELLTKSIKQIFRGLIDTLITKQYMTEDRFKTLSFATPFSESRYSIGINRKTVEFGTVDESGYFMRPFSIGLWTIFGSLTTISFLFSHHFQYIGLRLIMLIICFSHALFSAGYDTLLKADFIQMAVPYNLYNSLEALATGINQKKIQLMTGNANKMIAIELKNSQRSGWRLLNSALQNHPIIDGSKKMEYKCQKLTKENRFALLDTDNNFHNLCKSQLKSLQIEELVDEPALKSAYIFSKTSVYVEKVSRIAPFLAVEHLKKERKYKILKVEPKIASQRCRSILFADLYKFFRYYSISLLGVLIVFGAELIFARISNYFESVV